MPNNFPDWSGTWTNVKGFAGKTPWFTANWSALVDRTEDIADVIDTATAGYTTLNDRLDDFTTVADVNAIVGGGGTPSNIPITSLGVGTAIANQKIKVNPFGTGIIGVNDVNDITELSVGTATADQLIGVNSAGDSIIGVEPIIFIGGIQNTYNVWNQSNTNNNVTTTVNKTILFTTRYTNNCSYISDGTNNVVQITDTGYFRAIFTGMLILQFNHSSGGIFDFLLRPYLTDVDGKSIIFSTTDKKIDVGRLINPTNIGLNHFYLPFSMERIYRNVSGSLTIGCYCYCYMNTINSITRYYGINASQLTVTRVF